MDNYCCDMCSWLEAEQGDEDYDYEESLNGTNPS